MVQPSGANAGRGMPAAAPVLLQPRISMRRIDDADAATVPCQQCRGERKVAYASGRRLRDGRQAQGDDHEENAGRQPPSTIGQAVDRVTAAPPPVLHRLNTHLAGPTGPPTFSHGEWHQNREPSPVRTYARPDRHPRGLVRHKARPPAVHDVTTAAALTMDLRDYDFYLFTDDHDGHDRVAHRAGPTGYHLATLKATTLIDHAPNSPVEADGDPVPSVTLPEAIRHLDTSGRAFLIFAGAATTRAEILYRRYDGQLGHVTPIW
ncbi:sigma 54 modulation/S30EA ribosomal C-terminal domain-containing protein [Actinoplanes nipponensis]|uniref:sigma 54 modulation/S30EA ribosomal C-terminal domain-containing protein n=1 Tax=Actinoplanes nipponensis TaxID=135950 RepID=UPI00194534D8|nr:sigma 54 modulation/S30EA ribosomal C-terminal domain-containing protein [Actinoplanes nipponensis]